ncbi:hypothetical protein [Haloactinomyces albus]|uniref:Mce-associated membrane protein n=1 Tax=Haloactinomyces albus TaxID=1352928 RepID=A0AAE3ZCM1_9ACTN|nr:hypothetical protein [Haloactinomyces albus]MDR7302451.1 Mce-associated membrane protein [Haloactinomyces albus]
MTTASTGETRTRRSRVALLVAALLLAASTGTAGFFGVSWAVAATDESIDLAVERDQALRDGRQAIINVNTFDYRNVEKSLNRWERSSTGPFHETVVKIRKNKMEQLKKGKAQRSSRILDAALTELNARAGKARMIAVVEMTTKRPRSGSSQAGNSQSGQSTVWRSRYKAELTRVGRTWKLSTLGSVGGGQPPIR